MSSGAEADGGRSTGEIVSTWDLAWAERDALLAVARVRCLSAVDAEDAVSEAIVRSAEVSGLDPARLGGWLTTVTMRVCVDAARDRARHDRRVAYESRLGAITEDPATAICDRAEAEWATSRLGELPARQQRALLLKAKGHDLASIARELGVSDRVVDGLLQRARASMRKMLAQATAAATGACTLWTATRRTVGPGSTAVATVAAVVATITVGSTWSPARPTPLSVPPAVAAAASVATLLPSPPATSSSIAVTARPEIAPLKAEPTSAAGGLATTQKQGSAQARPGAALTLGQASVRDEGSSVRQPEQSFVHSLADCLSGGLRLDTETIGCDPGKAEHDVPPPG